MEWNHERGRVGNDEQDMRKKKVKSAKTKCCHSQAEVSIDDITGNQRMNPFSYRSYSALV
jgi:hypothetical protein